MKAEARFIYDWLAAHATFYKASHISLVSYENKHDSFGLDATVVNFYLQGKKCGCNLLFTCFYPVSKASVARALIELERVDNVKTGVTEDMILDALGTKSAADRLIEET